MWAKATFYAFYAFYVHKISEQKLLFMLFLSFEKLFIKKKKKKHGNSPDIQYYSGNITTELPTSCLCVRNYPISHIYITT